jgi:hypothetical protein
MGISFATRSAAGPAISRSVYSAMDVSSAADRNDQSSAISGCIR